MKTIVFFSLLASSVTFAEDSCLKAFTDHTVVSLCQESDKDNFYFFSCTNSTNMCFTGDAQDIVAKINHHIFENGDGGVGNATPINQNSIHFYYGDVGSVCEHTINKCQ